MKEISKVDTNFGFSSSTQYFNLYDFNTISIDGNSFYSSSDSYLKKYFSTLGFPLRFVKDFFSVSKTYAKIFFSDVVGLYDIQMFYNKANGSFIYLTSNSVPSNYCHFIKLLGETRWHKIYVHHSGNLVEEDTYIVFDSLSSDFICFVISLVSETIDLYVGSTNNGLLRAFHLIEGYPLDDEDFINDFCLAEVIGKKTNLDYLDDFYSNLSVKLTVNEVIEFLKDVNILKGSKKLTIVDHANYFKYFSEIDFQDLESKFTTLTSFSVDDLLRFSNTFLFNNENVSFLKIYRHLKKVMSEELYSMRRNGG